MVDDRGHLWRVTLVGRAAAVCACLMFLVIGCLLVADGAAASDRVSGAVMLTVAPAAAWAFGWRPYVQLTTRVVVIQNPVRKRTIPLGAVMGADAAYSGLSLDVRGHGRPLTAWAVQKMNLSAWRGRETRADVVAKTIMDAACSAGLEPTTVTHRRHAR